MNKTTILVVGRNIEQSNSVVTAINKNADWEGIHAFTPEVGIEKFHQRHVDMLVILNGLEKDEKMKLEKLFLFHNPDGSVVLATADTALELVTQNHVAIKSKGNATYTFMDDAFRFNINLQ